MARPRTGRGTREGGGVFTAPTLATYPSGVTLDDQGIGYSSGSFVTPTEVGYLDGAGGSIVGSTAVGWLVTGGNTVSVSGGTMSIETGLTTVSAMMLTAGASRATGTGVSGNSVSILQWKDNSAAGLGDAGSVSVFAYVTGAGSGISAAMQTLPVTVSWIAFGA